jgi:hypothetical protein
MNYNTGSSQANGYPVLAECLDLTIQKISGTKGEYF